MIMENAHQRKKEPELVRHRILEHAVTLAAHKGVTGVSIQAVADLAGVTKGGVFHHFPNKQKLLEAMIIFLLARLDKIVDQLIEQDPYSYGCFTRAYIKTNLEKTIVGVENSWSAISMILLTDQTLNEYWIKWLNTRLDRHKLTDDNLELQLLRYAADGIWLTIITGTEKIEETQYLTQQLINRSYQLSL